MSKMIIALNMDTIFEGIHYYYKARFIQKDNLEIANIAHQYLKVWQKNPNVGLQRWLERNESNR